MDFGMATFDSASHQELSKEMQKNPKKLFKELASELHQLYFREIHCHAEYKVLKVYDD
jgi:hypothetical protein